ncbi:hypothetical protein GUJ93_ZPchr0013g37038 [Zizania palustris]|uniref:Pectinesterase inhibitor domain-containing protein n=1 Tax=Zizania palustris TaxID=103762 RepID=A0A8J5X3E4_ZIZPA|nr:hypothetical protein GUJ93_ZPchr0013g37038 [Zizania palustris]
MIMALTTVLAIALRLSADVVDATVDTTCKAVADNDKRVYLELCVSQLGHHHDSLDADTWGLATTRSILLNFSLVCIN